MPFKMKTLDLAEDINNTFPYSFPSSPESTICHPRDHSFARSIVTQVAASVFQLFTASGAKPAGPGGKKSHKLPRLTPADIDLEFPEKEFPDQKQLRRFTHLELEIATDSFSEKNIVGQGGFGTVYRGRLSSSYVVAVKRLRKVSFEALEEFKAELEVGRMIMHRNVLPLIGFGATKSKELLLVYPFMLNGSLRSHLCKHPESHSPMDWETRKHIALGLARGLSYLHDYCSRSIIHRDIKSSNIMLNENLEPCIGDFGLARVTDHKLPGGNWRSTEMLHRMAGTRSESQIERSSVERLDDHCESMTAKVCGTYGYMPPEYYLEGKYSTKTDVFAFGIVLLELISCHDAVKLHLLANSESVGQLADWVKRLIDTGNLERIVARGARDNYSDTEVEVERLIRLSLICTQLHYPAKRPKMSEVVSILEGSSTSSLNTGWEEFQQNWIEFVGVRTASNNRDFCASPPGVSFANSASHHDPEELSGPR